MFHKKINSVTQRKILTPSPSFITHSKTIDTKKDKFYTYLTKKLLTQMLILHWHPTMHYPLVHFTPIVRNHFTFTPVLYKRGGQKTGQIK